MTPLFSLLAAIVLGVLLAWYLNGQSFALTNGGSGMPTAPPAVQPAPPAPSAPPAPPAVKLAAAPPATKAAPAPPAVKRVVAAPLKTIVEETTPKACSSRGCGDAVPAVHVPQVRTAIRRSW